MLTKSIHQLWNSTKDKINIIQLNTVHCLFNSVDAAKFISHDMNSIQSLFNSIRFKFDSFQQLNVAKFNNYKINSILLKAAL